MLMEVHVFFSGLLLYFLILILLFFLLLLLFCFCVLFAFVAFLLLLLLLLLLLFCFCCFSAFCVFVFLLFAFVAFLLWQLFSFLFLFLLFPFVCFAEKKPNKKASKQASTSCSPLDLVCCWGGRCAPPPNPPRATKSALHLRHPRLPRNQYFKVNSPVQKLLTNQIRLLC